MTQALPMFPLNTVLFPGVEVPLHVFEDRYRALVRHLLDEPDPTQRLFGSVAIREGYEVGGPQDRHGAQSLHRVGCLMQLTDVTPNPDGTFEVIAVGRGRLQLSALDDSPGYPQGQVELLEDIDGPVREETVGTAWSVFERYRERVSEISGEDVLTGDLPRDPTYLSWSLAATCLLTLPQRQELLEADSAAARLALVTAMLRTELRAMDVLPSLPATNLARNGWNPN